MGKIIIDNQSYLPDVTALEYVKIVMQKGRICNDGKQYCYLSTVKCEDEVIVIASFLNAKSDKFIVYNRPYCIYNLRKDLTNGNESENAEKDVPVQKAV